MNKTSVVIDGHTVSYWKYQLIDKLYKENNLKKNGIPKNFENFNKIKSIGFSDKKISELTKTSEKIIRQNMN